MTRIVIAILTGLTAAALLHLVIILSVPAFTGRDAFTRISNQGPQWKFNAVSELPGPSGLATGDPFMKVVTCAFDISETPVHFVGFGQVPLWTFAIFDANSNEVFSMNDRTSVNGVLDLVAATPQQLIGLRRALPKELAHSILIEQKSRAGYAVVRVFQPAESYAGATEAFLKTAICEPINPR